MFRQTIGVLLTSLAGFDVAADEFPVGPCKLLVRCLEAVCSVKQSYVEGHQMSR